MNAILTRVYAQPPGTRAIGETILAQQILELPSGEIRKLSLSSGQSETVSTTRAGMEGALRTTHSLSGLQADWERENDRQLQCTERLLPIKPFGTGGTYTVGNVHPQTRDECIKTLVYIYTQIFDRLNSRKNPAHA